MMKILDDPTFPLQIPTFTVSQNNTIKDLPNHSLAIILNVHSLYPFFLIAHAMH
jgi:hypothetical protein